MNNIKQNWLNWISNNYAQYPRHIQVIKVNKYNIVNHQGKGITSGPLLNIKNNPTKIPWAMFYFDKHKTLLLELYDMALTNNTEEEYKQKHRGRI